MGTHFERKLEELHAQMIAIGNLCEQAITLSAEAVRGGGDQVVRQVFETDRDIDAKEREIEVQCMKLLLLQQPVAGDLRRISAALRMVADMERIGDQASDIAEIAVTARGNLVLNHTHLKAMASAASAMVTEAIKSFVNRDLTLAHKVMGDDDVVDEHFEEVKREIICLIRKEEVSAEASLDLLMIAKYLERIADHAVNVAEWVEFSITGQHMSEEIRRLK